MLSVLTRALFEVFKLPASFCRVSIWQTS